MKQSLVRDRSAEGRRWRGAGALRLSACVGIFGFLLAAPVCPRTPAGSCPKVLMFDGVWVQKQNTDAEAKYWGQTVGVDGFFLNYVVESWLSSVGDDEKSAVYQMVKDFQTRYAKFGVTDNFLKVAIYKLIDWKDPAVQATVVSNFKQAAHLARYAGLKGLALDIEPDVKGFWNPDPAIPDKGDRAYSYGKQIGAAIAAEYPQGVVIVVPEVLLFTLPPYDPAIRDRYGVSGRFWDGLIQNKFGQLLVASENSYNSPRPDLVAQKIHDVYDSDLRQNGIDPASVPITLGLWPLGNTYTDKSARVTPQQFADRLKLAASVASPYVWIYGMGSSWEAQGPYGSGDVDRQFDQFVGALQQFKRSCKGGS